MPRPSQANDRREKLLPLIADAFGQLGYRAATTAQIAGRCNVRENVLYRLWKDKKTMFLASIDFLFRRRMARWQDILAKHSGGALPVERLLELTAENLGEQRLYRIIFAAFSETDDDDVRAALQGLYRRYHKRVTELLRARRRGRKRPQSLGDGDTAWALIGMVTVMNVLIDLDLASPRGRKSTFLNVSRLLLNGPRS